MNAVLPQNRISQFYLSARPMCYAPDEPGNTEEQLTLSQSRLNQIVAEERRTTEKRLRDENARQVNELRSKLDELAGLESTSAQQREEIESLTNRYSSAEDKAAKLEKLAAKREAEYGEKLSAAEKRYRDFRTTAELTAAASDGGAFNVEQLLAVLGPKASIIDVVGKDGKPTGENRVVITLRAKDELGADADVQFTPKDAIGHLKSQEAYFNLFKSNTAGGTGSHNGSGISALAAAGANGQLDVRKLVSTPEGTQEYMKLREAARKGDVVAQHRLGLKPNQR